MGTAWRIHLACLALMAALLAADLAAPLGVAMGVPYVAVVLLSLWTPQRRFSVLMAAVASVLVVAAFLIKPPAGELWKVLANRGIALFAIWVTAALTLQRKAIEEQRDRLVREREEALDRLKVLQGILPTCSHCRRIRGDGGAWTELEAYVRDHSEAQFSHGICADCARDLYPDFVANMGFDRDPERRER